MTSIKEELFELKAIKKTLTIAHANALDKYLNKIIKRKRRQMWIYIDGSRNAPEIANLSGATPRAVTTFLNYGKDLGIIEWDPRGMPFRIIDHVPADWIKDVEKNEEDK